MPASTSQYITGSQGKTPRRSPGEGMHGPKRIAHVGGSGGIPQKILNLQLHFLHYSCAIPWTLSSENQMKANFTAVPNCTSENLAQIITCCFSRRLDEVGSCVNTKLTFVPGKPRIKDKTVQF